MILHIKNMVSGRCKLTLEKALNTLGLAHGEIELGEVEIYGKVGNEIYGALRTALLETGLELISGKKELLIERIKQIVIEMVHYHTPLPKVKNSDYLSEKTSHDYTYLANVFSEATGMTIEHFIICHKIERAKQLIVDNELNLTEISYLLNYSSVAHLSNQFKQITGLTATGFKNSPMHYRTALENI